MPSTTGKHKAEGVGLLVLLLLCASGRWLLMSDPGHFTPWMPSSWFDPGTISFTRAWLNVASSVLWLVVLPLVLTALLVGLDWESGGAVRLMRLAPPVFPFPIWRVVAGALLVGGLACGILGPLLFAELAETYPVYRRAGENLLNLAVSESLVLGLILTTELFYRGIALTLLASRFGGLAVYLLVPLYFLDHVGAPMPELLGSIVTGVVLGHLALATRSIWPGVAIHAACAVCTDLTCLLLHQMPR